MYAENAPKTATEIGAGSRAESPIESAMSKLHSRLMDLEQIVCEAEDRLGRVLRPQPPSDAKNQIGEAAQSDIHGSLLHAIECVELRSAHLRNVLQRLTV